jgi:hypothetical protein
MGRRVSGAEHGVTVRDVKGTKFKSRCVRVEVKTLLIRVFCLSSWMSRGVVFVPIRSLRPGLRVGGPVESMRPVLPRSTSCLWSVCASGVLDRCELSRGVCARGGIRPATVPFHVNLTAICRSRGELTASRNTPISTIPWPGAAEGGCLEDGIVGPNPRIDVMYSSFSSFRAMALMTFAGSLASSPGARLPSLLFSREGTATAPCGGTALIWGAS